MNLKLHVVLAKTEQGAGPFKKTQEDYVKFFKNDQGSFQGIKKTYTPKPGTADEPKMRENKQVITTVGEKLDWLVEFVEDHITDLFTVDATNASGNAKAELVVDGVSFGVLSSLELLHLKSIVESGTFADIYSNIPVRSDAIEWDKTTAEQYQGREIFETELKKGVQQSLLKETYILDDPNISRITGAQYSPKTAERTTIQELGDYTLQNFSGEYSQRQRADILTRRTRLLVAITEALKIANEAETVKSNLDPVMLFSYLHTGKP